MYSLGDSVILGEEMRDDFLSAKERQLLLGSSR